MLSKIILLGGGLLVLAAGFGVVSLSQSEKSVDPVELVESVDPIPMNFAQFEACRGVKVPRGFTRKNIKGSSRGTAYWDTRSIKSQGANQAVFNAQKFVFSVRCVHPRSANTFDIGVAEYKCVSAKARANKKLLGCNFGKKNGFVYVVKSQKYGSGKQYELIMSNKTHKLSLRISGERAKTTLSGIFSSYMGKVPNAIVAIAKPSPNEDELNHADNGTVANAQPLPREELTLKGCEAPVQTLKGMPLKSDSSNTEYSYFGRNASQNKYTQGVRRGKIIIGSIVVNCKKLTKRQRARIIYVTSMGIGAACNKVKEISKGSKDLMMCESSKTNDGMYVSTATKRGDRVVFRFANIKSDSVVEVHAISKLRDQKVAAAKFSQIMASFVKPM